MPKNKIQYTHDSYGNIINQKEYAENLTDYIETEYVYQSGADLISETNKNENITVSAAYDYWGNPITQTDAEGNVTKYAYDGANRIKQQINPDDSAKRYVYTAYNTREYDELNNQIQALSAIIVIQRCCEATVINQSYSSILDASIDLLVIPE